MYCCTHVQSKWALVNREHRHSTAQHGLWQWGWREVELNSSDTHTSQLGAGFWTGNTRWRILSLTYSSKHKVSDVFLYYKTCSNFYSFYLLFSFSADHTMGRSNQPFVYVPHKRRGPISAEFKSPGPAAFNIPGTIGSMYTVYIISHQRS